MKAPTRLRCESQGDAVIRLLRERGRLTAREAIFDMTWDDNGDWAPITRIGARIWDLRRVGWVIDTTTDRGMAVYTLVDAA